MNSVEKLIKCLVTSRKNKESKKSPFLDFFAVDEFFCKKHNKPHTAEENKSEGQSTANGQNKSNKCIRSESDYSVLNFNIRQNLTPESTILAIDMPMMARIVLFLLSFCVASS